MTDDVPHGWATTSLKDVGTWGSGGTPSRKDPGSYDGNIPWLKIADLSDGPVQSAEESITEHGLRMSAAKLLPPNTLLVAMYGSIGKLGITTEPCATNQAIAFCKPTEGIDLQYLFYLLLRQRQALTNLGQGGTQLNISQTILKAHEVPIAPTNEQRRIVSKIDELFSQIDEGEAALKRVGKLVERYRQSVLKAAVTGELTRDWREAKKRAGEPVESGAALLARILKARRAAWEAAELEKMQARGKPPTDDRWKQKYQEPASPDTADLPELPEGWMWASLDMIADVTGGITVDAKRSAEGCELVPYLRVANVQRGYLDLAEVKSLLAPAERIKALALRDGDVLFNEGGDLDKLGRGWVWDGQIPVCIHQNHVFRARLYSGTSRSRPVSWYANEMGRSFFLDKGKQTTNLASISLTKLKTLPVPVMSELEADEIEGRASAALSDLERQISEVKSAKRRSTALRQSILKAAFSGQLVPQDPRDEPASKLLERIAAERVAAPAAKARRGRRNGASA